MSIEVMDNELEQQDPVVTEHIEDPTDTMRDWLLRVEDQVKEIGAGTEKVSSNFNDVIGELLSVTRTDLAVIKREKNDGAFMRLRANLALLEDYLLKLQEDEDLRSAELEAREETAADLVKLNVKEHARAVVVS